MSKKILFLVNHEIVIYNFRLELIERLLNDGYRVIISSPHGPRIDELIKLGCQYFDIRINRHGTNFLTELELYREYKKLIKRVQPDMVFSYTIKPNIYGGMVCATFRVPYLVNITGLGTAVEQASLLQTGILALYRYAFRGAQKVFCQNDEILKFFESQNIAVKNLALIPGSGVNLDKFRILPFPGGEQIGFVFISRIMKEKGIDLYLKAAEVISQKYPNTVFHVCGFCEQEYERTLWDLDNRGVITYHGMLSDIRDVLQNVHCTVHPSYYPEGISNALLESAASGRAVITTDRSGCREAVEDGVTGYIVPIRQEASLIEAIERFMALSWEEKREMGLAGREKMEREFNRTVVIDKYLDEIKLMEG